MGIFVADRKFLEQIGGIDVGMKVYGGENVELGIRVSKTFWRFTGLFYRLFYTSRPP